MKKGRKISIIFTILSFLAMALLIQVFNRPLHRITSDFYHPFFHPVSKVENLTMKQALLLQSKTSLVKEMLQLQKVNEKFSAEINVLQDIKKENADLKELLIFKQKSGFKCVFAEIYLRDPALWNESFSINKGNVIQFPSHGIILSDMSVRLLGIQNYVNTCSTLSRICHKDNPLFIWPNEANISGSRMRTWINVNMLTFRDSI